MPPESAEQAMLETVAFFDPIDYHSLRKRVAERLSGEYDTERHRAALENLKELDMVRRGGIGHEYVHITDEGWSHIGGETERHEIDVDEVDAIECPVCRADELVEAGW